LQIALTLTLRIQ